MKGRAHPGFSMFASVSAPGRPTLDKIIRVRLRYLFTFNRNIQLVPWVVNLIACPSD